MPFETHGYSVPAVAPTTKKPRRYGEDWAASYAAENSRLLYFAADPTAYARLYADASSRMHSATSNSAIAARLPFVMATSRFAHYLMLIASAKMRMTVPDHFEVSRFASDQQNRQAAFCERELNRWIVNYSHAGASPSPSHKAMKPLQEAKVMVKDIRGHPGQFFLLAYLRPRLTTEQLTSSIRVVAPIPTLPLTWPIPGLP